MKFSYKQTVDDVINFNIHHHKASKTSKRSILNFRIVLCIVYILFLIYFLRKGFNANRIIISIIISAYFLPVMIFYPKYQLWHVKRTVRKMIREGKNKGMIGDQQIEFAEDRIIETDPVTKTEYSYSGIERLSENEEYFFIYTNALRAITMKKDLFETEKAVNEFRQFIRSKISG
jgi:hypothetical protein